MCLKFTISSHFNFLHKLNKESSFLLSLSQFHLIIFDIRQIVALPFEQDVL